MKKRITASILALCLLVVTLTGCGRTPADDFFDVMDAIIALDNYHVELTVASDRESKNGLRLSGDVAESAEKAHLTLTGFSEQVKKDGVMEIMVDGSDVYVHPGDWATYLSQRLPYLGEGIERDGYGIEGELLEDVAKGLGKDWYRLTAPEPVFDLLHMVGQKNASAALSDWYKGLRKSLKGDVKSDDGVYTLSLTEDRLRDERLSCLDNLIQNEEQYRKALQSVFAGAEDAITASGWSDGDILDTMWSGYQERREILEQLKGKKKWEDGSLTITTRAPESDNAYQVSAEWTDGEADRFLQATILPAEQALSLTVPKQAKSYSEQAENLAMVYLDTRNLIHYRPGETSRSDDTGETGEGDTSEIDWNEWAKEHPDDTQDYSADLKTTEIEGSEHITLTPMETEDGVQAELPVLSGYGYCDATEGENGGNTALGLTNTAWQMDLYSLEKEGRSMTEILSESISTYVDTYQNDFEYEITQKPGKVQVNKDKTACVNGFRYFNTEEQCEITMIGLVTQPKDSDCVMVYELTVYGDLVKAKDIAAIEELCESFHLKLPVTVAQQK